jgi:hypothetical protein
VGEKAALARHSGAALAAGKSGTIGYGKGRIVEGAADPSPFAFGLSSGWHLSRFRGMMNTPQHAPHSSFIRLKNAGFAARSFINTALKRLPVVYSLR